MARIYTVLINNQPIEVAQFDAIGLRLDRMVQSATNFGAKGGDSSLSFNIPRTKNNNLVMGVNYGLGGINKFYSLTFYQAIVLLDGSEIFSGVFRLNQITKDNYVGEFVSNNIDWVSALDNVQLCKLGYVDGAPTWTAPYNGGATINTVNNLDNTQTDFICPTIVYNNTLQADYQGFLPVDVYGAYDSTGAQVASPLDFPDEFKLENAYFGNRLGLTFEDFPPALYYPNVLQKCFQEIGFNAKGEIFDEDWFNKLYLPYVGDGYQFNWMTLGYLYTKQLAINETGDYENRYLIPSGGITLDDFHCPNIPKSEDNPLRIDPVANFKKLQVTDEYAGSMKNGGYICPASGRYRIRVKAYYQKFIEPNGGIAAALLDVLGLGDPNRGWDDNVLVITRRDQEGDLVFDYNVPPVLSTPNPIDWRWSVGKWMNYDNSPLVTEPSDVIAYISPKRYNLLGNDIEALGSPLSDNQEIISVISSTHTILSDTVTDKTSESSVEIEIEIDMKRNERINFYWQAFQFDKDFSLLVTDSSSTTNDVNSEIEIQYLCGIEELDLAANLPCDSCKQLVSNFVNQFNLRFDVVGSNTVEFAYDDAFFGDNRSAYSIDDIVDVDTVVISPANAPRTMTIGYDNDTDDYLLMTDKEGCETTTQDALNYGNVNIEDNDNKYGLNDISITNGFSATKFANGKFYFTDTTNGSWGTLIAPQIQTPPDYPVTGEATAAYFEAVGVQPLYFYDLPSIQSQSQFDAKKLSELEYIYNYTPRILYHLGTSESYFGLPASWKIRINNAQVAVMFDDTYHWIQTTVSAFDDENNNPYPTLRYDTANGLYAQYFDDIVTLYNSSYILECNAWLRPIDWLRMKGSTIIKYQDNLYRLMSIGEFDPLGLVPSKLTLLKLI